MGDPLELIRGRRSCGRVRPDPVPRELVAELLEVAVRAPNHHLTEPWRFVVLAGDARRAVGEAYAAALAQSDPEMTPERLEKEASRLERAPVVVAAVVRGDAEDPVTAREDRDAVAAAVENLLLAAASRGLGAMWRTGEMAGHPAVRGQLGLRERDAVVAFVYLGWPHDGWSPPPTPRRALDDVVEWRW